MAGARLILNSRFFHIARAGEKADGKHSMTKDAAMGLVNYVGTREGVELNVTDQLSLNGDIGTPLNLDPLKLKPEVAARPATSKQFETIVNLLQEIPEAKNSLEYQDFKTNPSIGNASELISRAAELGLGYASDISTATNLIEYVGKRPGVDRVGEHGLFSSSPNVDIKKAQDEIANCKGNIWTHVISLRREDADMLGYNQQKPWRDLIMQKIDVIAKASNIPVSQLHWYAGMHNTAHHPHIHLFVFSDDPKVGHLTKEGINKMKSAFSEVIFADERQQIYIHKDEMRDAIKEKIDSILKNVETTGCSQFSKQELTALCGKITRLAADLKNRPGKLQFGWLKDLNICDQVNDIMYDLAKAPDIQKLYGLYCEDHQALQKMYRNDPKDIGPIVKNSEFRVIKNKIIREAIRLNNTIPDMQEIPAPAFSEPETDMVYTESEPESETDIPYSDNAEQFSDEDNFSSLIDNVPPEPESSAPDDNFEFKSPPAAEISEQENIVEKHNVNKNANFQETYMKACDGDVKARYQLGKMYFYGEDVECDYIQAQQWYGLAAEGGHSVAKYELGKMYLYGIGIDKNEELGKEYCLDAYYDMTYDLQQTTGIDIEHDKFLWIDLPKADSYHAYLEYLIGRMRLAGEGVKQDYGLAYNWFCASAQHEHVHSEYMLGKMTYDGQGCIQDYQEAANLYGEASDHGDRYACYAAGRMYYRGIGVNQDYNKAAVFFVRASKENVPYADYALAQMSELGQGIEKSEETAFILYGKALKEFAEQEKQQPDPLTECRIAKMYLYGKGAEINPAEAAKWFTKAAESNNAQAKYELAQMYLTGEGVMVDKDKAEELFSKALAAFIDAEKDNPSAGQEYRIAQMYEKWLGTEANIPNAIKWLSAAAENGHGHAAYRLGKFYADGKAVPKDDATALKWYLKAADLQDKFSYYALGQIYYNGTGVEKDFAQALSWFKKASSENLPYADYKLAGMYESGTGVESNIEAARSLYKKALNEFTEQEKEKSDDQTEYRIGSIYFAGKGTDSSFESAAEWFTKSAEKSHPLAEYQLAQMYLTGKGVTVDKDKAAELFSKALAAFINSEKDNQVASQEYRIGSMHLKGYGTKADPKTALYWFTCSAGNGNSFAAYQAAKLLSEGEGVPRDEAKAQELYSDALACFLLQEKKKPDQQTEYRIGCMYLTGKGTAINPEAALKWFSLGAEKGNAFAAYKAARILEQYEGTLPAKARVQIFYNLALKGFIALDQETPNAFMEYQIAQMFLYGKGTSSNPAEAFHWFSVSAEKGNADAQFQVGRMLHNGQGVLKDEQNAQIFYARALQGFFNLLKTGPNTALLYKIGTMYEFGLGVDRSVTTAKQWYSQSAQTGNENAADRLNQIESAETKQVIGSVFGIFRSFANFLGHNVEDSTTHKYRQDRKLMQKQRMLHKQKHDQEQIM